MAVRINSRLRNTARLAVSITPVVEVPSDAPSLDFSKADNSQYIGQVI